MYGNSIRQRTHVVDSLWVERFRKIPVANVSDVMSRTTAGGARLRPMHDGTAMIGVALTVKTRPGDNLMIHKALNMAEAGDVVVVDAGGDLTNSLLGELMLQFAAYKQVGGIVLNGAIRDYGTIKQQSLPIFAAGVTHRGPYKDGPGEINVPIAIDDMVIEPGDLMLGDDDGILCVPRTDIESIYEAAMRKVEVEAKSFTNGQQGKFNREWIDETLDRLGVSTNEPDRVS